MKRKGRVLALLLWSTFSLVSSGKPLSEGDIRRELLFLGCSKSPRERQKNRLALADYFFPNSSESSELEIHRQIEKLLFLRLLSERDLLTVVEGKSGLIKLKPDAESAESGFLERASELARGELLLREIEREERRIADAYRWCPIL